MKKALLAGLVIAVTVAAAALIFGTRQDGGAEAAPAAETVSAAQDAPDVPAGECVSAAKTIPAAQEVLSGKDFVSLGKLETLAGILETEDDEWYLRAGDKLYAIHLGNHDYRSSIGLQLTAGREAAVSGFVHGLDAAVVTIKTEGREYRFRGDDGRPLWAGRGGGRNGR